MQTLIKKFKTGESFTYEYEDIEFKGKTIVVEATVVLDGIIFDGILKGTDSILPYGLNISYQRKYYSQEKGYYFNNCFSRIYDKKDIKGL